MSRTNPNGTANPNPDAGTGSESGGDALLEVEGLRKHYDQADGFLDRLVGEERTVRAVDGVDLTLREGETLGIVGESGCGKSTLGETILNLQQPTAGSVRYRGKEIAGLSKREMRPYRRRMQIVFQDPLSSLNPRQTVADVLTAPMEIHGVGGSDAERRDLAADHLERVGLKPSHLDRYPHQFSGGQQQRVAIARALAVDPEFIVADEPVSALDVSVQAQILNLLDDLQAELDIAIAFIAHDLSVVRHVADRVAVMYLGEIVERAPVDDLFENPNHPYTRALLSAVPRIDPGARGDRILLEGTVPSPLDPPSGCRFHTRCPAVIPPERWTADQGTFKAAFTFRARVEGDEIAPDAVRESLAADGEATDDDRVAERIVERSLPCGAADLPADAAAAVREAAEALVAGDDADAVERLREAFPTPCERDHPEPLAVGDGHRAACHRVDPAYDADPTP